MVLALLLLASAVLPKISPDGFTKRVWQTQDGLPENMVQAFAQTRDQYLWIGTTGGLVRFDGARFVVFDRDNTPEILENSVFALATDRDGGLWAGTDGGGLVRYQDGVFRSYSTSQGLMNGFVRTIYQDRAGVLWVGTDDGLYRLSGDQFVRLDANGGIPQLAVHAIAEDLDGSLWVGGSKLIRIQGSEIREFPLKGNGSAARVKSILQTGDGTVWVGTVSGLQQLQPKHTANGEFEEVKGISSTVRALWGDASGTLLIGSIGQGLLRYSKNRPLPVPGPDGLPSGTVLALFKDSERNIWVGMQTGLLRLSPEAVSTFRLAGTANADFGTIYSDRDGTLWVAGTQLSRINAQRSSYKLDQPLPPDVRVRNVFRDHSGALWLGTEGYGVVRIKGGQRTWYTKRNGLVNDFIRVFLEDRNGSIWIGTDQGVSRWHHGSLTTYEVSQGLCYRSIRDLLQDSHGDIWIGTERGVSHWDHTGFVKDDVTKRLANEKVWTIHEDREGDLWFGTRGGGLYRWSHGTLQHFNGADGLASNSIYKLLEDNRGIFWMSGPNGISSVSRFDLDRIAGKSGVRPAVTLYGLSDGIAATQMYGGVQPAGCLTQSGELWFPSNRGPVRIVPSENRKNALPRVVIEQLLVDGRETKSLDHLAVPPGEGKLQIDYSAIRLRSQERLRFRYKLEGFDSEWTEALQRRVAYYTNLPAGDYRFRVQAFEMDMPRRFGEASLAIRWEPHLYRTGWFLALCGAVLAGAVFAGYRFKLQQVQARFDAVLAERNRVAREMHDTVIQGCTGVSAVLEAVASLGSGDAESRQTLLDCARLQVRATADEARCAIWNLRQNNQSSPHIGFLLKDMAQQVSKAFDVVVRVEESGDSQALESAIEHDVLMVTREAVSNAVHHGHAREIQVQTQFERGSLRIRVLDDGAGFDTEAVKLLKGSHFGLIGMRERAECVGGRFLVESVVGKGTDLSFEVPLGRAHPAKVKGLRVA